ncbi:hypothetical protein GCM10027599_25980 [Yimella radicis]
MAIAMMHPRLSTPWSISMAVSAAYGELRYAATKHPNQVGSTTRAGTMRSCEAIRANASPTSCEALAKPASGARHRPSNSPAAPNTRVARRAITSNEPSSTMPNATATDDGRPDAAASDRQITAQAMSIDRVVAS